MGTPVRVVSRGELPPGTFRCVEAAGKKILLYNLDGELYATDETCAHNGGPLSHGLLEGHTIVCPWHAWQFDVRTGKSVYDPGFRIATYPVTLRGDDVFVEV